MMVAGTADFTGYRQVNPDADLGFIAWPGPEAGKYSTNDRVELLYTVSQLRRRGKQARRPSSSPGWPRPRRSSWSPT